MDYAYICFGSINYRSPASWTLCFSGDLPLTYIMFRYVYLLANKLIDWLIDMRLKLIGMCLFAFVDIFYHVPLYHSVPIYTNSLSGRGDGHFSDYFPPPPLFPPPPPSWHGNTNAILREAIFTSINSQKIVRVHFIIEAFYLQSRMFMSCNLKEFYSVDA